MFNTGTAWQCLGIPLQTTIDGRAAWAICDKISTFAVSRLLPDKAGITRMPEAEFHDLLGLVLDWLPGFQETLEKIAFSEFIVF